ncbi:RNA-binding (RRM/RBD/RNP motifs) family protein [Arabidopsis thaliana]|uniref:RNA-binding (RRM/RBD/RNP motifs) family protein n=1 Tax=Arabidopsis thaliana TaxID=3702 RepID=F4JXE5_ARATH|nr:RNA-binding (RRM/RBD/RNP motifs) family protein [Arabidopsis thaliana]AED97256.1 RNA-binding (RRM/RBD/RNP motifs) family protein [Arabidopsis thaliana]|eukprot:NP_974965.1 RNA-binding (RRM/RBD/RNP motifs) family protein [Arabidopsis thaliana]
MSTGLDMSLDDMIAKNRKSRGGAGPARGTGSGSGPGPTRRNNPNRKSTRSAPYQSAPESTWGHDMFSDRSEDHRSGRSSAGIETGTKLYISNLDYGVMNEDIKELFAEVGELKRYTVHFDRSGRSKGTAEVVYSRRGDALAAVKKYNDVQLDGKPMKIEIVGTNLQTAAAPSGRPANGNSNGAPWRGGQGRGGQQRGGGRGGGGRGGGGRGRRPGKGPAEKISAEDLDADLDKYHSGDMETN